MSQGRPVRYAIVGASLVLILAGCTGPLGDAPQPAAPGQSAQPSSSAEVPEVEQPKPEPTRRTSLEVRPGTLLLTEDALPSAVSDKTHTEKSGEMIAIVECDKGRLDLIVEVGQASHRSARFQCNNTRQLRSLGKVVKGDTLVFRTAGDDGTQYAFEIQVRKPGAPDPT
jgi:hypothetical protein